MASYRHLTIDSTHERPQNARQNDSGFASPMLANQTKADSLRLIANQARQRRTSVLSARNAAASADNITSLSQYMKQRYSIDLASAGNHLSRSSSTLIDRPLDSGLSIQEGRSPSFSIQFSPTESFVGDNTHEAVDMPTSAARAISQGTPLHAKKELPSRSRATYFGPSLAEEQRSRNEVPPPHNNKATRPSAAESSLESAIDDPIDLIRDRVYTAEMDDYLTSMWREHRKANDVTLAYVVLTGIMRSFYCETGLEWALEQSDTVIKIGGIYNDPLLKARGQLWKAIVLDKSGVEYLVPQLLAEALAFFYNDGGDDSDAYQMLKLLPRYLMNVWGIVNNKEDRVLAMSRASGTPPQIDDLDHYSEWVVDVDVKLQSRYSDNWPQLYSTPVSNLGSPMVVNSPVDSVPSLQSKIASLQMENNRLSNDIIRYQEERKTFSETIDMPLYTGASLVPDGVLDAEGQFQPWDTYNYVAYHPPSQRQSTTVRRAIQEPKFKARRDSRVLLPSRHIPNSDMRDSTRRSRYSRSANPLHRAPMNRASVRSGRDSAAGMGQPTKHSQLFRVVNATVSPEPIYSYGRPFRRSDQAAGRSPAALAEETRHFSSTSVTVEKDKSGPPLDTTQHPGVHTSIDAGKSPIKPDPRGSKALSVLLRDLQTQYRPTERTRSIVPTGPHSRPLPPGTTNSVPSRRWSSIDSATWSQPSAKPAALTFDKKQKPAQPPLSPQSPMTIDPGDLPLTDTPSPVKLKEDLPDLEKHQDERRKSVSSDFSFSSNASPEVTSSAGTTSIAHASNGSNESDAIDWANIDEQVVRDKMAQFGASGRSEPIASKGGEILLPRTYNPNKEVTAAPLTPTAKSPPTSAIDLQAPVHHFRQEIARDENHNSDDILAKAASQLSAYASAYVPGQIAPFNIPDNPTEILSKDDGKPQKLPPLQTSLVNKQHHQRRGSKPFVPSPLAQKTSATDVNDPFEDFSETYVDDSQGHVNGERTFTGASYHRIHSNLPSQERAAFVRSGSENQQLDTKQFVKIHSYRSAEPESVPYESPRTFSWDNDRSSQLNVRERGSSLTNGQQRPHSIGRSYVSEMRRSPVLVSSMVGMQQPLVRKDSIYDALSDEYGPITPDSPGERNRGSGSTSNSDVEAKVTTESSNNLHGHMITSEGVLSDSSSSDILSGSSGGVSQAYRMLGSSDENQEARGRSSVHDNLAQNF